MSSPPSRTIFPLVLLSSVEVTRSPSPERRGEPRRCPTVPVAQVRCQVWGRPREERDWLSLAVWGCDGGRWDRGNSCWRSRVRLGRCLDDLVHLEDVPAREHLLGRRVGMSLLE